MLRVPISYQLAIMQIIQDPLFYAVAIPAVLITSISKGGFAGGLGIVAVPLMALAISPTQAASIMLPILCVMDLTGFVTWRKRATGFQSVRFSTIKMVKTKFRNLVI